MVCCVSARAELTPSCNPCISRLLLGSFKYVGLVTFSTTCKILSAIVPLALEQVWSSLTAFNLTSDLFFGCRQHVASSAKARAEFADLFGGAQPQKSEKGKAGNEHSEAGQGNGQEEKGGKGGKDGKRKGQDVDGPGGEDVALEGAKKKTKKHKAAHDADAVAPAGDGEAAPAATATAAAPATAEGSKGGKKKGKKGKKGGQEGV